MQKWSDQDAKAHGSDFLDTCVAEGSQMVTQQSAENTGLTTVDLSHRLPISSRPNLKQLLLSDVGRTDLILPDRGQARRRQIIDLSSI
jgi:antitoxin Phd